MKNQKYMFQHILYYCLLILPLILIKQISILGENIFTLVIIMVETVLICKKIVEKKGRGFIFRRYSADEYIAVFFLLYALGKILLFTFGVFQSEVVDMGFYTVLLAIVILYLSMDFSFVHQTGWLKYAVLGSSVGSFLIFLTYLSVWETDFFVDVLTATDGGIEAYLLLANLFHITHWILRKKENWTDSFWLLLIGFHMLVLLLEQSHIGNWIVVFCLLSVASFFRPRAFLIKKIGILLFLFLFLWSNLSLLLNYTTWFQIQAEYSLENSVYMELFLAVGSLGFFHFWDRMPQRVDLQKISMIKMQHYFRMLLGILIFIFLSFLTGREAWQTLPDTGIEGFVKALAVPLSSEIIQGSSHIFRLWKHLGIVPVLLLILFFYQKGIHLYKKCGVDEANANCFFMFYLVFLLEILIWELPSNILFASAFIIAMGNSKT